MNQELTRTLCRNGFELTYLAPSSLGRKGIPPNAECIAICCRGCNTKRTGKFVIPIGAAMQDQSVREALRHAISCRNAQKRKASKQEYSKVVKPVEPETSDNKKLSSLQAAVKVLKDETLTSGKEQVRSFKRECGGTYAQFMRLKYRLTIGSKPAPF